MHNFEITEEAHPRPPGRKHRLLARLATLLKVPAELVPLPDPTTQMTSPEQRLNLWHLADAVLAYEVPGDFADVGCFNGVTSALLAGLLARTGSKKTLHLYDSFEHQLGLAGNPLETLRAHFEKRQLPAPVIHAGRFESTLPAQLPATIAFAQIDCGVGGPPTLHAALLEFCLGHVWTRLAPGGVCVVQDYHDPASGSRSTDYYPFIKPAVDRFLAPHGVAAVALVSGPYSHGFVRKPLHPPTP